jgi:hypothetical protein
MKLVYPFWVFIINIINSQEERPCQEMIPVYTKAKKCVFTVNAEKRIGLVNWIFLFFFFFFFSLVSVIFLYLLTVLNTLSTAIDDIIPYTSLVSGLNDKKVECCSRGRKKFEDIINFPKVLGSKRKNRVGQGQNTHTFFFFWPK